MKWVPEHQLSSPAKLGHVAIRSIRTCQAIITRERMLVEGQMDFETTCHLAKHEGPVNSSPKAEKTVKAVKALVEFLSLGVQYGSTPYLVITIFEAEMREVVYQRQRHDTNLQVFIYMECLV
nr:uncharacterized protein LOC129272999 [Lytechinus pictus]